MKARLWMAVITIAALVSAPLSFAADEKIGIFEMLHASSISFDETTAAVDAALATSGLKLHAAHDVRVPRDLVGPGSVARQPVRERGQRLADFVEDVEDAGRAERGRGPRGRHRAAARPAPVQR